MLEKQDFQQLTQNIAKLTEKFTTLTNFSIKLTNQAIPITNQALKMQIGHNFLWDVIDKFTLQIKICIY